MPVYSKGMLTSLHDMQIAEPEGYGKKGSAKQAKAAFADGTALPAKRPRISNTADPDAARSNKRVPAITDFFNSLPSDTKPANRASDIRVVAASPDAQANAKLDQHITAEPSGIPDAAESLSERVQAAQPEISDHRAKDLSVRQGADTQLGSKPSGPDGIGEPSAERKRQIMADAAVHRLTTQQQYAVEPTAQLSLPSTSATHPEAMQEGSSVRAVHGDALEAADTAHVSAVIDLVHDDDNEPDMQQDSRKGRRGPTQNAVSDQQPSCPICGETWSLQTSSAQLNAQINEHMDICLGMQLL